MCGEAATWAAMTSSLQGACYDNGRCRVGFDELAHMLLTYALGKFAAITGMRSTGTDS